MIADSNLPVQIILPISAVCTKMFILCLASFCFSCLTKQPLISSTISILTGHLFRPELLRIGLVFVVHLEAKLSFSATMLLLCTIGTNDFQYIHCHYSSIDNFSTRVVVEKLCVQLVVVINGREAPIWPIAHWCTISSIISALASTVQAVTNNWSEQVLSSLLYYNFTQMNYRGEAEHLLSSKKNTKQLV